MRRLAGFSLAVTAALALIAAPTGFAAPGGPSGDGVQPTEVSGNPNCATQLGPFSTELKDDSPNDEVVTDGTLTVTIDVRDTPQGEVFDFTANITLDMVIVKGGDNSNVYSYPFEDGADTGLHAPVNPANGRFHDLSHISFCYDAAEECEAPAVTTNPTPVTTTYGDGSVSFTAAASGDPTPTVQWQVSTSGASGPWTNIPGASSITLTIAKPTVADSGNHYRAVFTNDCGTATTTAALLTVNPKPVTGAFTAADKVYDGNTSATITGRSIVSGIVGDDDVTLLGGTATFGDKNVGSDKPVTSPFAAFSLGGADAANYTLVSVANTTADITPRPLTATCTVADKVYDGTTAATVTGTSLGGSVIDGDDVTLDSSSAASAFADPDVGEDKPVPCNGLLLAGEDVGNYTLTVTPTTASITPKLLTATCTVADKLYDGTTRAVVTGGSLGAGVVAGDDVGLDDSDASSAFADPRVGDDKPVPCNGLVLTGASAGNYTLATNATTADIDPRRLVGTCEAADKDFDGTTDAEITGLGLIGVVGGESVSLLGGEAQFDTPDPGQDKPVDCSGFSIGGPDVGNYELVDVLDTAADIRRPPAQAPTPRCLRRKLFAFIRAGDQTKRVAFFLDGKKLATVTKPDRRGRFGVLIDRREVGPGKHVLRATIHFTKGSKRKPLKLIVVRFTGCLAGSVPEKISVSKAAKGSCVRKPFFAFVRGDTISRVVFSLNGKRLRRVKIGDGRGRYKVTLKPSQLRPGSNAIRARIKFIRTSGTPVMTLRRIVRPCR